MISTHSYIFKAKFVNDIRISLNHLGGTTKDRQKKKKKKKLWLRKITLVNHCSLVKNRLKQNESGLQTKTESKTPKGA